MLGKFLRKVQQATGVNVAANVNSAKRVVKTAGKVMDKTGMSSLVRGISKLNMNWQDGSQSSDDGSGRVLRNWDVNSPSTTRARELFLTWDQPNTPIDRYLIFIAWKGWAAECLMAKGKYFSPQYAEAFVTNQLATVRHLCVEAGQVEHFCLSLTQEPDGDDFYYLKLVGIDAQDNCLDIPGAVLASQDRRESHTLAPVPEGNHPSFPIPADGSREANDLERDLVKKAQD